MTHMLGPPNDARIRAPAVNLPRLFAILVACALLLAPAFGRTAAAVAATAGHAQMMDQAGHCQMPPSGSADHHKMDGKSCCVWMCVAVPADMETPLHDDLAQGSAHVAAFAGFHIGYLGEIATPPPRRI